MENEMTIAQAKFTLKQAGYFVDNLWHIQDVYNVADGNIQKDQAMQVLSMVFNNETITQDLFEYIKFSIEILNEKK
jgi:hypothetical protein